MALMFKKRKFWKRLIIGVVVTPVLLFGIAIAVLYWKQDQLVQYVLDTFNEDFVGEVQITESHISPFSNFPHITVDLEGLTIWEGKDKHDIRPIVEVEDAYLGFDFWTILSGVFDINFIHIENGELDLIFDCDGSLNVQNALASPKDIKVEDMAEEFHLHLKSIMAKNLDVHQFDKRTGIDVETFLTQANASFKSSEGHTGLEFKSQLILNVIDNGDTTAFRHKHLILDTHLDFEEESGLLTVNPSKVMLEHGDFSIDGTIALKDSMKMDLKVHGNKSNFDLFIAFAPEELIPILELYDNAGDIYFEANVTGTATNGIPAIEVNFGCDKAFLKNNSTDKKVTEMHFDGHFSNTLNPKHDLSAMEFSLRNIHAVPEAGYFDGNIHVRNFETPDIDMDLKSDFRLDFLSKFLNLKDLSDLKGKIVLNLRFHDIIDLNHPELSIAQMNEAYHGDLLVKDLSFRKGAFYLPIDKVNAKVVMDGHKAQIKYFDVEVGKSDVHVDGNVNDLPAILHHTDKEVVSQLNISSTLIDLAELTAKLGSIDTTKKAKPVDEQLQNFKMKFVFKSSARAFTESKFLPEGEFFISDFYAKLKHYPHTFHDFNADIFIEEKDLRVVDFSGMVDKTDFHFHGKLHDYGFWFSDSLIGITRMDYDLTSKHMQLEDLFAYKGENHVPEDYRHEVLNDLKIHGIVFLNFNHEFKSADMRLTQVNAKMKVHPLKFRNFNGRVHYEDQHVQIDTLFGQIGKSSFNIDLNYYIGEDEAIRKRDNHLGLHAQRLDLDELMNYNPAPSSSSDTQKDHEAGFNIYDLPFSSMTFDIDVKHLNYHKYLINNLVSKFKTTPDHHINIEKLKLNAAGGTWDITGSFDGRNRDKIFLDPTVKIKNVNLDKLLFKFDNFGQDHIVAENLHGILSGTITGHIHVHPDLVPKIDDSDLKMDIKVMNGRIANYAPLIAMSEYFGDKNLSSVRFDSLENTLDLKNGILNIPNMTLNTSLGHMDFSGNQRVGEDYNMEYYVRVPMKMVTSVAKQKLFGKKNEQEAADAADAASEEDEIIYKDHNKKTRYMNIKITGNADDYKFGLGKDKRQKRKKKKQK